jgi:hypothetical protein
LKLSRKFIFLTALFKVPKADHLCFPILSSDFFCCLELMSEGIYRRVRKGRRLWRKIHGYYKEACLSVWLWLLFAATTVRNFTSWVTDKSQTHYLHRLT